MEHILDDSTVNLNMSDYEEENDMNPNENDDIDDMTQNVEQIVQPNVDQSRDHTASAKKRKVSKSYGGALLDFSDSFKENLKEVNKEFLEGQAMLQQKQQEFEQKMAEDDRNFLRSLFQPA